MEGMRLPDLVKEQRHFIAFGKSRRTVEVILKEARDKLDAAGFLSQADSRKIAGYRGGYTPLERKEIERKMMSGELNGLVSTNALELGIDIGSLDTTVIVGYPGTRASFWQQSGRAGRNGQTCVNYLILENQPFDQYIAVEPGWLFEGKSENAIVDPDNLLIELAHIRAAAAELPLSLDDAALFPSLGEIIPVLMKAEEVKSMAGRFAWSGPAFPAGDYSLRNMDKTRFKLILDNENREITEMDESQAYHELHPGAVYMHDGALYEVLKLDLVSRTATAKSFEGNYYTVPAGTEDIRILQTFQEKTVERTKIHFGDINVDEVISMFKKLQFHNHQNLGYVSLTQPLQKDYDTESTWIDIPEDVVRVYRSLLLPNGAGELVLNNHFEGLQNAIKNAAMMVTMTERDDINTGMSNNATVQGYVDSGSGESEGHEVVSLFIYDKYEGGLGYSEKIYELIPEVIDHAIQMVKGCSCEDGCPACVGDYTLSKKMVLWGLRSLKERLEAPEYVKKQVEEERPGIRKQYSFFKLPEKWNEFCETVIKNGESGGAFLKTAKRVEIEKHNLILIVDSYFYEDWLKIPENAKSIKNILKFHAVCPQDMEIVVRTEEDMERKKKTEGKLKRRYEDKF